MFNAVMEIDAMQYASISREILRNDNFLHLFDNGQPYLDKPPLIFWVTALFFKIFGPSEFVYRLPSIIFTLTLIYSTYRFSILFYSEKVSQVAALILASSEALFIMNADVRTDIYMITPMMVAIWQFSEYFKFNRWKNLIIGWIAISFSMMGKGPIGIVIPLSVLTIDSIFNARIRYLLDKRMFFGIMVCLLCLLPMSYGLYTQFGFQGLEFFYWTQSFGRITGASSWSNATGPFYLFNVFLYAFLPWTLLSLLAVVDRSIDILKKRHGGKFEIISLIGFILPMVILSASNYKLPHYIYCVIPFVSVLSAVKIDKWIESDKYFRRLRIMQFFLIIPMLLTIYGIVFFAFGITLFMVIIPFILILIFFFAVMRLPSEKIIRFLIPSIIVSVLCSYGLNQGIMKPLLEFQSTSMAAKFVRDNNYEFSELYLYNENSKAKSRSFNFYLNKNIKFIDSDYLQNGSNPRPELVFTNEEGLKELKSNTANFIIIQKFDHIRVSKLHRSFIDPKTRSKTLRKKYLIRFT